jgi:Fatty acid hydroxylase superfamily
MMAASHPLAGSEISTVGAAWREFRAKRAPWVIAAAIAGALAGRVVLGDLGWADLAAVAFMLVVYPFGEWAIHVHLLHLPPLRVRGRRVELPTARAHRQHHERPERLDLINFSPLEAMAILLLAVPVAVLPVFFVLGLGPAMSALLTGYALVGVYEWTHFLIHTAHRPRSRYFRSIWRTHRLHHFKNEHYWHGITNTVADRVIGTFPDHHDVPRSRTARSLRGN